MTSHREETVGESLREKCIEPALEPPCENMALASVNGVERTVMAVN